ncbi:MAG: hypothetical protein ACP5G0_12185 [Desulfomonilia bacterium]
MSHLSYIWYCCFQRNRDSLSELNGSDHRDPARILEDEFRSFRSTDEYNRDFLCIYQSNKRSFLIDYSQKDGHFRV